MIDFLETQKSATPELSWMIQAAKVTKNYEDCVEKKFQGKVPHFMAMGVLTKNKWGSLTENGKAGINHEWLAQSMNAGLTYNARTGLVTLTFYQAN